jgi:hypothetical protein
MFSRWFCFNARSQVSGRRSGQDTNVSFGHRPTTNGHRYLLPYIQRQLYLSSLDVRLLVGYI